jgi:hypothetical protein
MMKQAGFAMQKEKEMCAGEVGQKRLGGNGIAEDTVRNDGPLQTERHARGETCWGVETRPSERRTQP